MKLILQDSRRYILRFDKGEEVLSLLTNFLKDNHITACYFSGIGACENPEIAFFNPHVKEYRKKVIFENLEILSFVGNGSAHNGDLVLHAHGVFGKNDFSTVGGHVFALPVSVTCEVFLISLDGQINRENNAEFNLNLLA